jgi:hypothetical protein
VNRELVRLANAPVVPHRELPPLDAYELHLIADLEKVGYYLEDYVVTIDLYVLGKRDPDDFMWHPDANRPIETFCHFRSNIESQPTVCGYQKLGFTQVSRASRIDGIVNLHRIV